MSKTIKGHEIFKLIANKEVKDGTQFRMLKDKNIYTYRNNNFVCKYGGMNVIAILNNEFEIIEEQEEIDIQNIEELEKIEDYEAGPADIKLNRQIINKLVQAVKQLDKKMKEE